MPPRINVTRQQRVSRFLASLSLNCLLLLLDGNLFLNKYDEIYIRIISKDRVSSIMFFFFYYYFNPYIGVFVSKKLYVVFHL